MDKAALEKLKYRRQYILTPFPIDSPFVCNSYKLSENFNLYTHIDLHVTNAFTQHRQLFLLGDIYSFEKTDSNFEILNWLVNLSFGELLVQLSKYCGRFVIIFIEAGNVKIVHDAAASRKVYYFQHERGVCCASQPHLLAKSLGIEITTLRSKLDFYNSTVFKKLNNSNIGNTTIYDKVFQLIPNHYLNLNANKSVRYWPFERIVSLPYQIVVESCATMMKGFLESIASRNQIMLPVTAGKDSRLLLSATKEFKGQVFYYINKEKCLNDNSYDISIPRSLFRKLKIDFHIVDPYIPIDEDFLKVYFDNNPFASSHYLPIIHNYYVNFENRINLPGSFVNIAEDVFESHGKEINATSLAKHIHVENFDYAVEYFDQWLYGCEDLCRQCNLNILNLLYWEERMANWGTQLQLDKDIAQDEILPYNSRLLIQTILSAKLSDREKPYYRIWTDITKRLWAEVLQEPCNPNIKTIALKISKTLGLMTHLKSIYYLLRAAFKNLSKS